MGVEVSEAAHEDYSRHQQLAGRMAMLENHFEKTDTYWQFRKRVFGVLAQREARLRVGKTEQKGAALIGPAGAGKSRIVREIIAEHHALAEQAGDHEFGHRVLSVIVPGRATVKETLSEILMQFGHPLKGRRDEEYLGNLVTQYFKECRIAGLHLDEVQDSGRYKTKDSIEVFIKRFRNMMQHIEWPICLILTATPEGRSMINHDPTLTRRLRPMEMKPMSFREDGRCLRTTMLKLLAEAGVQDPGLLEHDEFIKIVIHASAGRFGVAVELIIEAIGECLAEGSEEVDMGHFAEAYALRTDCHEEMNPFLTEHWKQTDTMKAFQRVEDATQVTRRRRGPR